MSACPKCRTVTLETPPGAAAAAGVLGCGSCGGIFVPQPRVEDLAHGASPFELNWNPPRPLSKAADSVAGICPEGHGMMTRARVELEQRWFMLERCGGCGGIWFDGGEWAEVAASPLVHQLTQLWAPEYRKSLAHRHADQLTRKLLVDKLGAPLVDQLERLGAQLRQSPYRSEALALLQALSQPPRGP